ncbi:MAG: hypothetical protein ABI180_04000 [Microcoleus sp.]
MPSAIIFSGTALSWHDRIASLGTTLIKYDRTGFPLWERSGKSSSHSAADGNSSKDGGIARWIILWK